MKYPDMPINPAETPIAQPLLYVDASKRMGPGARPDPLGRDFARGVSEPIVRIELSDTAKEMQTAQAERAAALRALDSDNLSRADKDRPPSIETEPREKTKQRNPDESLAPPPTPRTAMDEAAGAYQTMANLV